MATVTMPVSARNQISGRVVAIQSGSAMSVVTIMANGQEIISAITNLEVKEMGLKTNDSVLALIKSTDTMLLKGDVENINISANNKLSGRISDIHKGIAMGSVTINTESGKFTSAITRHAIDELGIQNGEPVTAIFNATEVLLQKI